MTIGDPWREPWCGSCLTHWRDHGTVPRLSAEEKTAAVLAGQAEGIDRSTLAVQLGYKNAGSLDVLMRRNGFRYKDGEYVPKEDLAKPICPNAAIPGKVGRVLAMIEEGKKDFTAIAQAAGFTDHRDLGRYMASQGWSWSTEQETYVKADSSEGESKLAGEFQLEVQADVPRPSADGTHNVDGIGPYLPLLDFLFENEGALRRLLSAESDPGLIPRYTVPGVSSTKSFFMSTLLAQLITDFSEEKGIPPRAILEAALIDYLRQYGFGDRVDKLLKAG
jgi:hypothetical protein